MISTLLVKLSSNGPKGLPRPRLGRLAWFRRGALGSVLVLMFTVPAFGGSATSGTPTALAPLTGDTDSFATDINNRGEVSGRSEGATTTAVRWDLDGSATQLLPLGDDLSSYGEAINNRGEVVGISHSGQGACPDAGVDTAVVWNRHGTIARVLMPLDGDGETRGYGINNQGIAVGISIGPRRADCTGSFTGVRWDRQGIPTPLASPSAVLDESFGYDINDNGIVAGFNNTFDGSAFNATAWDRHGVPMNLPTPSGGSFELANGLNNNGQIVGTDFVSFSGLVWDKWGNATVLSPFGADLFSTAVDINTNGHTVGSSFSDAFEETAVVWDAQGVPSELLPLPGDTSSSGLGINGPGAAVGHSSGGAGTTAVVWR